MPEGHKARAILERVKSLPGYLSDYVDKFKEVAPHRKAGWNGVEPLLETLDVYDRKLHIDREPEETEILLTLDLIERSEGASKPENPIKPKAS